MPEVKTVARPPSGAHERHLAISSFTQQIAQFVVMLTMIASITVLARQLPLAEFGTYGLLLSLTTYVLFIQGSIAAAAMKAIAEAPDQSARDRAFSTAVVLYAVAGVSAAVLLAIAGSALIRVFEIPSRLDHQAQLGVLALAVVTSVSWPLKAFQDLLRGRQEFVASAVAEIVGYTALAAALIAASVSAAPLWLLAAIGAAAPLATGGASALMVMVKRLPDRFASAAVTMDAARGFLKLSTYVSAMGVSGLVIYSLDRVILGTFRSAAVVGLYEGPSRAHNAIQQINATLSIAVLPAASRYRADRDDRRTHDLFMRGTRYSLAAVVPVALVLMILARPILTVWLGPKFGVAATAMTILVSYWLFNAGTTVFGGMLIAAGRVRTLSIYAAAVAALNLGLSLILTPFLGLNGVVLGTSISYAVGFPFILAIMLSTFHVRIGELAREAWLPAYSTGALIAVALIAARAVLPLATVLEVAVVGALALLAYWALYYAVWLRPSERVLVRSVAGAFVRR